MDRYEYRTKMEQIEKAKSIGDYQTAGKIAETIEWARVKRVAVLCDVADIYDRIGRYEDCREILLMAYERSPIGRMIVYRLCDVSIKLKNLEDAKEYFNMFIQLAPSDPHKFILQYKMEKTSGAPIDRLITILENLKSREFMENWAYELAYLYHKKGLITQCVDECNDIFLWFGEGKYVEKALELKLLHQPLTPLQMERYEYMRAKRISEQKRHNRKVAVDYEPRVPSEDEMDIAPVEVKVQVYDTINLQQELAKSMDQIMNATSSADVTKSLDNVKNLVNDSRIPELKIEEREPERDPEEESSFNDEFKSILAEEYDGQISFIVPDDQPQVEKQITGQLSIEDVLAEWDMAKRAVDKAYEAEEARRLEKDRARAIAQTEDIITKLGEVMPKYQEANAKAKEEAAAAGRQRLKDEETIRTRAIAGLPPSSSAAATLAAMNAARKVEEDAQKKRQEEIVNLFTEVVGNTAGAVKDAATASSEAEGEKKEELSADQRKAEIEARRQAEIEERERIMKEAEEARRAEMEEMQKAEEETRARIKAEAEAKRKAAAEAAMKAEEEERVRKQKAAEEEKRLQEQLQAVEEARKTGEIEEAEETEDRIPEDSNIIRPVFGTASRAEEEEPYDEESEEETEVPSWEEASNAELGRAMKAAEEAKQAKILSDTAKLPPVVIEQYVLSAEQKEEFSYFMQVKGIEEQICKLLCDMKNDHARGLMDKSNIIISGAPGMGKTKLAASLVKVIQQIGIKESGKFGKISSEKLNGKSVEDIFMRLSGGCLVIEKAASMEKEKALELLEVMTKGNYNVTVILEDAPSGLSRLLGSSFELAERFRNHVSIPIFNNDELISFGKAYAAEQGFTIDEMGVLAMYNRIGFMQYSKQDTMLEEVMDIVDYAIKRATKGLLKIGRKKEGILKEKDFS